MHTPSARGRGMRHLCDRAPQRYFYAQKGYYMKTLQKKFMSAQALDMCETFDVMFKNYGDVFTTELSMEEACLCHTDIGIDIADLTGMTLGEALPKLPSFGVLNLYYRDTDNLMQFGLKREHTWDKKYLSDPINAWHVENVYSKTIALDCVVKEFYYHIECGMFIIIIDEPVETTCGLTRSKRQRVEINPTITLEIPEGMTADEVTENFFNLIDTIKDIWYVNAKHTVYEVE